MAFSKQPLFLEAFEKYYKDIVELNLTNDIDDFSVTRVDTRTGEVMTKAGKTVKAALANIIPDQKAGSCHCAGWDFLRPEPLCQASVASTRRHLLAKPRRG